MESGQADGPDWDWVELKPERSLLREELGFRVFLVQAKSESEPGRKLRDHPLEFFRDNIQEMEIPREDVQAMVLRVNAEVAANQWGVSLCGFVPQSSCLLQRSRC